MAESQNQFPVAAYREPLHDESFLAAYLHENTNLLSSANKVNSDGDDEFKCTHWKSSCALSFYPVLFFLFGRSHANFKSGTLVVGSWLDASYNVSMRCSRSKKSVQREILGAVVEYSQFHGEVGSFLTSDSMCLPSSLVYRIDAVSNIVTLEDGLLYHLLLSSLA